MASADKPGIPLCPFCGSPKVYFNAYHAVWNCGNCEQVFPSPSYGSYRHRSYLRFPFFRRTGPPRPMGAQRSAPRDGVSLLGSVVKAISIFLLVMLGALTGFHMLQGLEFQAALARDGQDGRALYEWGVCGFEVVFMPNDTRAVYEGFRDDEIGKTLLPQTVRTWDPKECPDVLGAVESLVGAPAPSAPSVGVSPVPANRPTATARIVQISTPTPVRFAVPTATIRSPRVATPTPTLAPTPTATTSRRSVLSESAARDLRQLALSLINNDRAKFGLPPVALGSNQAAQLHADDMLEHQYLGHWWVDGRKPYMVYTQTGGTSYVAE
ncbi:MAG: hypothetical protein HY685_05000, partial [Chloroflexi bacterium]|nr:hypothetical protein [Chloroflexota bacterium]